MGITMTLADLISALEQIAPLDNAEPWDNTGLILGDPGWPCAGPVLLTIDLTGAVLDEAIRAGAGLIIAYHPPIWNPIRRIGPSSPDDARMRVLLGVMRAGIPVYSPHTALDAASGGVTDWLADSLSPDGKTGGALGDRRAIQPATKRDPLQSHKIVTFVPATDVEAVRNALASVGAGMIGAYSQCSFSTSGTATFFPSGDADPVIGQPGRLEQVDEVRLEMVCPARSLALAVEMLRQFHPYEEPAFDIHELAPKLRREIGAGRRIVLDRPATSQELALRLKMNLGVDAVKLAAASDGPVERIGVCPGAGSGLLETAIAEGCQLFVTGEMRHHEALAAVERGCSILLAGHTNTERGFLPIYADRINELIPEAAARPASSDRTLFRTLWRS